MAGPRLPKPDKPERVPGVDIGDDVYFDHAAGPHSGRVLACGEHGVTLDAGGKQHRVKWDKVLGHKRRAYKDMQVVDDGEDGMILADEHGRRRYVQIPPEAREDTIMVKSGNGRRLLFLKAEGGIKGKAGLALQEKTDKLGRKSKHWVRTNKEQPKGRQKKQAEEKRPRTYGKPDHGPGDRVKFKAGDFEGTGEIVGKPGQDGAHVRDDSGRVHQVHWHEISGKAEADKGADKPDSYAGDHKLFDPDHIASLPNKVNQPHDNWEDLTKAGAEGLEQFKEALGKVGESMGLKGGVKPEDLSDEDWASDQGYMFVAPLKGEKRAREKVEADYGGDWSQLRDIVRGTISVPTMGDVKKVLAEVQKAGIELAQKPKDRFAKPTEQGYRDLMKIVKLPNGMLAELQIHVKPMTRAKDEGHEYYNVTRSLQGKYGEDEPSDRWSEEDHTAFYDAHKKQQDIYSRAWKQATGGGENLTKSLPEPKMIMLVKGKRP